MSVGEFFKKKSVTCRFGELVVGEKVPSLSCRVGKLSVSELSKIRFGCSKELSH